MGIFSGKTIHTYTPYSTLLYHEMPSLIKQTVASTVVQNRNLGKDIVANLVNGVFWKANSLYEWAKTNHPWGLPDGYIAYDRPADVTLIEACVRDDVGEKINIVAVKRSPIAKSKYEYEVIYTKVAEASAPKEYTWKYTTGTGGKYEVLEVRPAKQESPYYPIIPVRINGENIGVEGKEHRAKIKKALSFLNLKLDDIYTSFDEATKESGEQPAEDMFVILAVSIASSKPAAKEYIYEYFKYLHSLSSTTQNEHDYWLENGESKGYILPVNKVTIQDSRFAQELEFDYINVKTIKGSIGKRGTITVKYVPNTDLIMLVNGYFRSTQSVQIRKQINEEEYEDVYVHGLVCRTLVVGSSWVDISLGSAFDNPDEPKDGQCFLIPLNKDVCKKLGPIKSHDLMYESIRLYSNDHYSYKQKWYETGFFKVFSFVVSIVVTIICAPAGIALMSAAMAMHVLTTVIVPMIVIPIITTLLEDVVGDKVAFVISVLATAIGMSGSVSAGSISISTNVSAQSILNASTALASKVIATKTQEKLVDYGNEIKGLQEELDAMYEEAAVSGYNVAMVASAIKSDAYAIMEPSNYVQRALMEPKLPTMITEYTSKFVDIQRYLDSSKTVLNLGHNM